MITFPVPTTNWGEIADIWLFDTSASAPFPMHESGWPQWVIDTLGRPPQVGDWYAECCTLDLGQIETAEDLLDLFEHHDDGGTAGHWFANEAQARAELGTCGEGS